MEIPEKTNDFTSQKINVNYNGEIQSLSFLEIEAILNEITSLRSTMPFAVWSKKRIITQSATLSSFAQNFAFFLNQKMYFDAETVFKMNVEMGCVKLFNLN
jgi:hypothetical protein